VRATKRIEWNQFYMEKDWKLLLDETHLHGEVFLPGSGMVNIPFWEWMMQGRLVREGESSVEMQTYEYSMVERNEGEYINLEPMFHHMSFSKAHMGLIGVEVGVHLAENAEKILKMLPMKRLYLIDPYDGNPDYQYGNPDLKAAKESARKRLEPYGDTVVWIYEHSARALHDLYNMGFHFHFVYHDSDHRRKNVKQELPLGYQLVMPGGYWGGHDYKNTLEGLCGVKSCVDEFVIDHKLSPLYYSATMLNWWVIKA
jgi:hypothetical protein